MPKLQSRLPQIKDYPAHLNKMWDKHIQPREDDAPTVISLFAGCGGSSLGYSMAGYKELLAVEWDDNAAETFKLNFPDVPVYHGDICKLSVDEVLETTGLKPGELDILDGSPPCQGFSTAGKRSFDDSRNQLFKEYIRLLRGLQPKVFVMENVSGMVKGKMKLIFVEILKELKASGYQVSARLMNTMWFGVPQARQRIIFIGTRNDLKDLPSHPRVEKTPITAGNSIKDIGIDGMFMFEKENLLDLWNRCKAGKSFATVHPKGHYFNHQKAHPDKPFPTLTKTMSGISHWKIPGLLSIPMVKRCQSFPDQFKFIGKYSKQWGLMGNSVPPLFMEAIARHIKTNYLDKMNT